MAFQGRVTEIPNGTSLKVACDEDVYLFTVHDASMYAVGNTVNVKADDHGELYVDEVIPYAPDIPDNTKVVVVGTCREPNPPEKTAGGKAKRTVTLRTEDGKHITVFRLWRNPS